MEVAAEVPAQPLPVANSPEGRARPSSTSASWAVCATYRVDRLDHTPCDDRYSRLSA
jgi:hypothetical protein